MPQTIIKSPEKLKELLETLVKKHSYSYFDVIPYEKMLEEIFGEEAEPKWEPLHGNLYWVIGDTGNIFDCIWTDHNIDKSRAEYGNCFPDKQAAERFKADLQEFIKSRK